MKSILSKINAILNIADSYQAPERMLQLVLSTNKEERDRIYLQLADLFDCDYSKDWFFEYFQEEHADRRQNKQDFTPPSIASVIHSVLHDTLKIGDPKSKYITYDPAAGTGQLIIRDWWLSRKNIMPWDYKPMDNLVVCGEMSVKTVPFLLFNLSVRGICGMVFHMNTMTEEVFETYVLTNPTNDTMKFSDVNLLSEMK